VGTGVWVTEVPQRGQGVPGARYAYTVCSGQTHFRDVLIEDIRCRPTFRLMRSLLPLPYSSKKTL